MQKQKKCRSIRPLCMWPIAYNSTRRLVRIVYIPLIQFCTRLRKMNLRYIHEPVIGRPSYNRRAYSLSTMCCCTYRPVEGRQRYKSASSRARASRPAGQGAVSSAGHVQLNGRLGRQGPATSGRPTAPSGGERDQRRQRKVVVRRRLRRQQLR